MDILIFLKRTVMMTAVATTLAACGGAEFGSGNTSTNTTSTTTSNTTTSDDTDLDTAPVAVASSLDLNASSRVLLSNDPLPVIISASAKDANNVIISDADIQFSVNNNGSLSITSDTGVVQTAELTSSEFENRLLEVTATSGSITKSLMVEVQGSGLSISGPDAVTVNSITPLLIQLKDSRACI